MWLHQYFAPLGGEKKKKRTEKQGKISQGGCKRKGKGRTYTGGKLTSSERTGGIDPEKQSLMLKTGWGGGGGSNGVGWRERKAS